MRRFLAGRMSVFEDWRMDGYFMRSNGINGTTSPSSQQTTPMRQRSKTESQCHAEYVKMLFGGSG
jgi:hypothetical protein